MFRKLIFRRTILNLISTFLNGRDLITILSSRLLIILDTIYNKYVRFFFHRGLLRIVIQLLDCFVVLLFSYFGDQWM